LELNPTAQETGEPTAATPLSPARPSSSPRSSRLGPQPFGRLVVGIAIAIAVVLAGVAVWDLSQPTPPVGSGYHGQIRAYDIAANPVVWNYTPSGTNEITGGPLGNTSGRDLDVSGGPKAPLNYSNGAYPMETFLKCIYQQYPNASFASPSVRPASEAYLGLDGPVIYAAVGDTIEVEFRNNCPFATSISPLGVTATAASSGMTYNGSTDSRAGGDVAPGGSWNYTWQVTPSAGPGPMDPSSVLWVYTDGAAPLNGTDTGLFGALIVTSDADANPNGTPDDVSANYVLLFGQMDESQSPFFAYNLAHYVPDAFALTSGFLRFAINGYTYGNMPMITLGFGEHVRWYVADIGGDSALPFWHGNTLVRWDQNVEVVGLLPKTSAQLDMWGNTSGIWLLDSDDTGDLQGGMEARYTVLAPGQAPPVTTLEAQGSGLAATAHQVMVAPGRPDL
jgi:hypothetical protein